MANLVTFIPFVRRPVELTAAGVSGSFSFHHDLLVWALLSDESRRVTILTDRMNTLSAIDPATGRELRQQRVVLYADGRKIIFQDSLRARSTFYRNPARHSRQIKASLRDPRAGCLKTLDGTDVSRSGEIIAGEEKVGDLMTVLSRVTQGQTLDIWYAPSLGCEIVRRVVTMDGGMQSIQSLKSYRGDAEDMTLFAEPEDYEEVAPSEAAARMFERMHGRRPAKLDDGSLKALDKEYSASRRR